MEKKLTKKELKEMEEVQKQKYQLRIDVINAVKKFRGDVNATERYYELNDMKDKLNYSGNLINEEKEKLLRRYDVLNFLRLNYDREDKEYRIWYLISMMSESQAEYDNWRGDGQLIIDRKYLRDGLWNNDIIWNENQIDTYLKYAKQFGYKYFITTDTSTACMREVTWLTKKGAVIVDVCTTKSYQDELTGLVFDISNVQIEEDKKEEVE